MDIRNLTFEDGAFDIVIDKGNNNELFPFETRRRGPSGLQYCYAMLGTMDAMMTAKGDVWVGVPSILCNIPLREHPHPPAYRILHNKS
jgi:hypothetical protein